MTRGVPLTSNKDGDVDKFYVFRRDWCFTYFICVNFVWIDVYNLILKSYCSFIIYVYIHRLYTLYCHFYQYMVPYRYYIICVNYIYNDLVRLIYIMFQKICSITMAITCFIIYCSSRKHRGGCLRHIQVVACFHVSGIHTFSSV